MSGRRRVEFRRVAPRLERAHHERQAELARESAARVTAAAQVLHKKALVAHRELQLIRAGARPGGRRKRDSYIAVRERKLDEARRELERAEARAARLGLRSVR